MTDTPAAPTTPRTDESLAEYVRHHQCWQADPNVTIADWHRGILAIEAEARATPAEALDVERWIEAYREAVDRSQPEEGDCECGVAMEDHAGGWALLHHDEQMIRNAAEVYARRSPKDPTDD